MQRWGSALNLNPHGHLIVLDGVYFINDREQLAFKNVREPSARENGEVLGNIAKSTIRHLRKIGVLGDVTEVMLTSEDPLFDESPALGAASKA